jgi:hypothetical protein
MKALLVRLKEKFIGLLQKKSCRKSDKVETVDIANKPFPECFLRGFNTKECFTKEQNIAIGAFQFGNHTDKRNDNYHEASINWEDDEGAVKTLLEQKKEGTDELMFQYGYARLPLNLVKMTLKSLMTKEYLDFERKPLMNNPYHGNILIPGDINRQEKSMIQNNLAAIANNDTHLMNL